MPMPAIPFPSLLLAGALHLLFANVLNAENVCSPAPNYDLPALKKCIINLNQNGGGIIDLGGYTYRVGETEVASDKLPDIKSSITLKNGKLARARANLGPSLLHVGPGGLLL